LTTLFLKIVDMSISKFRSRVMKKTKTKNKSKNIFWQRNQCWWCFV